MNYINKAFILELSYRLTVAVNASEHDPGKWAWMPSWNDATHTCTQQWLKHLTSSIKNDDSAGIMILQTLDSIDKTLSRGYRGIVQHALPQDHQDTHVYQCLLYEAHNIAHNPAFSEWELSEFFIFGQQLAQNDLRTYFSAINKPEVPVTVSAWPKFTPLPEKSFPRSWPDWPTAPAFNDCLARYIANRQRFSAPPSFSIGSLVYLTLSIVCPSHFPSMVWY